MAEIFGINDTYAANVEIDELVSERQTVIGLLIDRSGTMHPWETLMQECLGKFKGAVMGAKERDEMLIGKTLFASDIVPGGYLPIDDMTTDYTADGTTLMYDCIIDSADRLIAFMEKLQKNGIKVKAVLTIFSDGKDNGSRNSAQDARRAVELCHSKEIPVSFIGFGSEARGIAQTIGIKDQNILETDATESDLRRIFTILSKSAISASRSAGATGPNDSFFDV